MMKCLAHGVLITLSASCVSSFSLPQYQAQRNAFYRTPVHNPSSSTALKATTTDAIAFMAYSQQSIMDKISASIQDIVPKSDLSWTAADGVSVNGSPATLDAFDAPGDSNIAWLASVCIADQMSSLTIFNGPLTDVPHLLSRCIINKDSNTMSLSLDYRPRAYGAYELVDANGNYPGPEKFGRDAFTYSGNRKDFDTKFGTEEVASFLKSIESSLEGATASAIQTSEYESLTRGPLSLNLDMPITDRNVDSVNNARVTAADYWLKWALEDTHFHRPGAPINSQYVYDAKYRQNAYMALLPIYNAAFGADGQKMAVAESGPLDEAYVGGGS